MFKIGVFALIFNEAHQILLCHRTDYDLWNLPGGGLNDGEAPWDGILREVKEETGLDVVIVKLQGIYSKADKAEIVFSFICEPVSGELTLNEEASDIRYFDLDELPENFPEKQRSRINDYLENKGLTMKTQEGPSILQQFAQQK